jgi:hypothetical protein
MAKNKLLRMDNVGIIVESLDDAYSGFDFTTIERVEFVGHQFNSNLKGNRSRLVGFYVDGGSANRRQQRN